MEKHGTVEIGPKIVVANLEIVSFLRKGEGSVSGDVMRQRAIELGANLSRRHAKFLLEHQQEIPKKRRKYSFVFPRKVWCGSGGHLCVDCVYWFGGQWVLGFQRLERDWSSRDRLLRPRK